jgi:hypothetical protein
MYGSLIVKKRIEGKLRLQSKLPFYAKSWREGEIFLKALFACVTASGTLRSRL